MSDTEKSTSYVFGPYRLTPEKRLLQDADGRSITLRGKVFDLLWHMVQNRGRLVEKSELLDTLWLGTVVEENNLSQTVSALRHALDDDAKSPKYLATIKGRGYQFVGEVRTVSAAYVDNEIASKALPTPKTRLLPVLLSASIIAVFLATWMNWKGELPVSQTPVIERFADARVQLVTDYAGSHSSPAMSPDGRMMAYVSDASGLPQIWIKNLQRGDPIRITNGPYPASSPTWSSKDDQILFTRSGPEGRSIFTVGMFGKPEAQPIIEHAASPNYALNADAFVYTTGSKIWLARNNGRDREQIAGIPVSQGFAARTPALSPDGTLVAFIHAEEGPLGNLWVIPSAGGEARQLTTQSNGIASAPAWSPDSRYIVYSVNAVTGGSHLWRVDLDSGEPTAMTSGPGGADEPALAADGTRLAYKSTWPIWRLTRIDPLTRDKSTLFESRTPILLPAASQDHASIVFFTKIPTGMQLFTIDSNGENLRQRTFDDPGANTLPTWGSDKQSILYYRGRSLYRLNLADGSDTKLFGNFHWSSKNWLDAHGDRFSYHNIDRPTRQHRTVVREFGESEEIELPVPIQAAQWSRDGEELVGFFHGTGELLICSSDGGSCRNILVGGVPLMGSRPMWSNDGRRIYYLRGPRNGRCCILWCIDRDGTNNEKIVDLPDFDVANSQYDFDANGAIFYNHVDRDSDEIWLATIEE